MSRTLTTMLALAMVVVLGACGGGAGGGASGDGASEPGGATESPQPAAGGESTDKIDIVEFNFKPATIAVKKGTTVTWTNKDNFAHTVKGNDGSFAESPNLDTGQTFTHTFGEAGSFPYLCGIHNSMTGTVTVS